MVGPQANVMVTGCNHELMAILLATRSQGETAVEHAIDMISISVEINADAFLPWKQYFLYKGKRWINRLRICHGAPKWLFLIFIFCRGVIKKVSGANAIFR
jgi:hypothetical protein